MPKWLGHEPCSRRVSDAERAFAGTGPLKICSDLLLLSACIRPVVVSQPVRFLAVAPLHLGQVGVVIHLVGT